MQNLILPRGIDWHVHLRSGKTLETVLPFTAQQFRGALVMPNDPAILSAKDLLNYRKTILDKRPRAAEDFEPIMTIQLTEETTPEDILAARSFGARAAKVYPRGGTTASHLGVQDFTKIYPCLEVLQKLGMVLCYHGEMPDAYPTDREIEFHRILISTVKLFPKLRIVMEHITCSSTADLVEQLPDTVAATITVHHLMITLNDVMGGEFKPHLFCKPVAKRPEDRDRLLQAALSGNPKFFLGTDSAPHPRSRKEAASCCAGIFTAPVALPQLAEIFDQQGALHRLADFTAHFGSAFYGLQRPQSTIRLVKENWKVPEEIDGLVLFRAGETLAWRMD